MSDNIIDELYSSANKNKVLPRLIIQNNDSFDTLLNIIRQEYLTNPSINNIYEKLVDADVDVDDIIVIYFILTDLSSIDDEYKEFIFNNSKDDVIDYFRKEHIEWNPKFEVLNVIYNNQEYDLISLIGYLIQQEDYDPNDLNEILTVIKNNNKNTKEEYIIIAYFYYLLIKDNKPAIALLKEEYDIDTIFNNIGSDQYDTYADWKRSVIFKSSKLTKQINSFINQGLQLDEIIKKLPKVNIKDIIMNYYELSSEEEGIIDYIYHINNWLVDSYLQEKYKQWITINGTEYDDSDGITLHKWRYYKQKELDKNFPIILTLVRPRTIHDRFNINGTDKLIFESLPEIIMGSIPAGEQSPADIYSYIKSNGQGLINEDDIAMTFRELYIETPEKVTYITDIIYDSINRYNIEKSEKKKGRKNLRDIDNIDDVTGEFYRLMDIDNFTINYDEWSKRMQVLISDDDQYFNKMLTIYTQFRSYDQKIDIINTKIISSIKSFNPTFHGRSVTIDDGYDIFNKSRTSKNIPFICYNDSHGKSLFKVFNPRESLNEFNDSQDYKFILEKNKLKDKDTIYMTMWLGNEGSIFKAPQKSFFIVIYHLNGNKLTIESRVKDESEDIFNLTNNAYTYTQEGLPSIVLGEGHAIKTRLEFDIKDYSINEYIFIDYLLMDDLMKRYLYIDESKDSFAEKKRLDVHYNHLFETNRNASVSFTISQKDDDLHINVNQADPESVDKFMLIFSKLLIHYREIVKNNEVKKIYDDFLPGLIDEIQNYINAKNNAKKKQEPRIRTITLNETNKPSNKPLEDSSIGSNIIKNYSKSLSTNGRGYIPKNLEMILNNYSDKPNKDYRFYRYGTTNYPNNSLLHCVCYAVDHPDYINLEDDQSKEIYIMKLRKYIKNKAVEIPLLSQELFDFSDDEIIKLLENDSEFFDPYLLYRAIEEIFNINLYVFTYDEKQEIEIPRNKIFHSRPTRLYRPTILIMKIRAGNNQIPKCELIVDYNEQQLGIIKLFGESMTNICHNFILEKYSDIFVITKDQNEYVGRNNLYYHIDNMEIFNNNIISQFIDNDGKMRAITVNINNKIMTISVPPSQPENVPILSDLKLSVFEDVVNIFGIPTGFTLENNKINGLWFKVLDLTYGYYVPIFSTERDKLPLSISIGPDNPLSFNKTNVTSRLRKMKRTLNIVTELIKWLYMIKIDPSKEGSSTTPYLFQKQYFQVIERNVDSSNYYDLSNIERRLPDEQYYHNIDGAIKIITRLAPTLFKDNKIIMYSEEFSARMKDMLITYDKTISSSNIKLKTTIDNFYMTIEDYDMASNSKIFLSRKELDNWLLSLKSSYQNKNILHTTIGLVNSLSLEPFVYQTLENNIYIVQNTEDKTPNKALTISKLWQEDHVNYGPNISGTPMISYPHFIYGISSNSQIYPIVDNTNNEDEYLEILYYGSQGQYNVDAKPSYAALLRLI